MDTDSKFEEKLKDCIEKYGRKEKFKEKDLSENLDSYSKQEYYYFYYEKVKNPSYSVAKELGLSKDIKFIYYIYFFDDDISDNLRDITKDPDLYDELPCITKNALYFCINDLRIKYKEDKFNNDFVKRILDFTEELFHNKYKKIEKMIENGVIDFESLWYYIDRINTIYKVKHLDYDICFKYNYFTYRSDLKDEPMVLYGHIIYPGKKSLNFCEYKHNIQKFIGVKKLESIKIERIDDHNKEVFIKYGEKVIDWYKNIQHMNLKGKQYTLKGDTIICYEKHERVIVDYEGFEKYSNSPFDLFCEKSIDENTLTTNDKIIIFPFVSLYNLGINKRWGVSYISCLEPIIYQTNAFDYLVLDHEKKTIVKCLINNKNRNYDDFIEGKGNGLVFLLYGPPGVGKTLTAEATCEFLEKPLYSINVGDLGTDPEHMEGIMNTVLDYVKRWDAIIMIDEVDVFLEEREANMIIRNAMVGIFLRLLEYHDGIMFLTTNRLTKLDPAVKSRINLTLAYKELNNKMREKIWKSLFNKWNIKIKNKTLKKLSDYNLNGREIRNYMKLVFSIHQDKQQEITDKSILNILEDCFNITEEFDKTINNSNMYL